MHAWQTGNLLHSTKVICCRPNNRPVKGNERHGPGSENGAQVQILSGNAANEGGHTLPFFPSFFFF